MNEVECGGKGAQDCNSNHTGSPGALGAPGGLGDHRSTVSCLSNASSQDVDFIQDNSDYQWFLDYGYRDGGVHHHTSILSSLSESYGGPEDVGYYEALSKNLDANLAEADMESFRTEDIHALLTTLPAMCTDMQLATDVSHQGEMFASVSGSMMAKFDFDSSMSPHSSSQGEESAASPDTMSICKSELLFSPVKETPMPGANFSVDSLDCELFNEHDIMLTCQANKDNYTIAFEGSMTMYSEESYHKDNSADNHHWNCIKNRCTKLESSMARSDSGLTTWSKLKKRSSENQLRRHPSGNNNTPGDENTSFSMNDNSLKSQSMPNLHKKIHRKPLQCCKNNAMSNSSIESSKKSCVKVFDIQHQSSNSALSDMVISMDAASLNSDKNAKPQPHNFSLVKLFMKQKSISAEGMSTAMDQSSASECWPNSPTESQESLEGKNKKLDTFEDSLVEPRTNLGVLRKHDLIQEELEDVSERSESVEQLTESPSRADSIFNSYEQDKCYHKLTINKSNVNNNNSLERIRRRYTSSGASISSNDVASNISSPESTDCTKLNSKPTIILSKHAQFPVHLMNKSMQTSIYTEMNSSRMIPKLVKSNYGNDLIRVIEPSFLSKLKKESDAQKPIYVVYPNYTLPDLDFLKDKQEDVTKVFLMPQRYNDETEKKRTVVRGRRPFSCNDMEALKKKGFGHIRDWDSLTFLLPVECRQVLADVPEFMDVMKEREEDLLKPKEKPLFCVSPPMRPKRPVSCDYSYNNVTNVSSSSSTATQPSSGYRGSSTMLTDSSQNSPATTNFNPLFVYRYDSVTSSENSLLMSEKQRSISTVAPPLPKRSISLPTGEQKTTKKVDTIPPRPPLPKGILRKNIDSKVRKNIANNKRYSMFEMGETDEYSEEDAVITQNNYVKRKSLHEPYYMGQRRTFSEQSTETEDEGVEAGHATDSSLDERFETMKIRPPTPPLPKNTDFNISCDELDQLEDFLKLSGISYTSTNDWDESELLKLRSHVSKFLSLKINKDHYDGKKTVSFAEKLNELTNYNTPPNSPNVSAMRNHYQTKTLVDMPICEEGELSPEGYSPKLENVPLEKPTIDLTVKKNLVSAVTQSVEQLIHHFSVANDQGELNTLGDAEINPACAKLVLSSLCPALYALLSDGLKPFLESPFGAINNSVWQVVEASAQQGPLTKALNELVMKINSEDVISEGMLKFNAFVFGLLNVRSLDAWASYLRTRETILRKHYCTDSLLLMAQTGGTSVRSLLDTLIATLQPLALLPFQIDLLFEYRELHRSLKRMDSYHQPTTSPTHIKYSPTQQHLTSKQLTLMKLVRSIQSSMSCDESEDISTATILRRYSPCESTDPSLPDLLNSSAYTKTMLREDRQRPRSCVDPNINFAQIPGFKLMDDAASTAKKRWSGVHLGSKFGQAFDRLGADTEEEYTDSLENNVNRRRDSEIGSNQEGSSLLAPSLQSDGPESLESHVSEDNLPINGGKFRRLQLKWEMLSGKDVSMEQSPPLSPTHTPKSKIPRLVTSPVKASGIPVLSPKGLPNTKQLVKKVITPPGSKKLIAPNRTLVQPAKKNNVVTRTSRVDQLENPETRIHPVRPSSLPYRPVSSAQGTKGSKLTPPRRAVSSSVTRKPQQSQIKTPKVVKTLTHRLPSDNGHLSFNEGEKLKVILEVDSKWLLCCRGDQKGLVPRSAIMPVSVENTGRV